MCDANARFHFGQTRGSEIELHTVAVLILRHHADRWAAGESGHEIVLLSRFDNRVVRGNSPLVQLEPQLKWVDGIARGIGETKSKRVDFARLDACARLGRQPECAKCRQETFEKPQAELSVEPLR